MDSNQLYQTIQTKLKVNYYFNKMDKDLKQDTITDTFMSIWTKILEGKLSNDINDLEDYIFIASRNNAQKSFNKKLNDRYIVYKDMLPEKEFIEEEDNLFEEIVKTIKDPIESKIFLLRSQGLNKKEIIKELEITDQSYSRRIRGLFYDIRKKFNK
jgi:hypothetical protein